MLHQQNGAIWNQSVPNNAALQEQTEQEMNKKSVIRLFIPNV